jgi:hypothetical protein
MDLRSMVESRREGEVGLEIEVDGGWTVLRANLKMKSPRVAELSWV